MQDLTMKSLQRAFNRNLPSILTGAAVLGVIGTVVLAVKATPKAVTEIGNAQEDKTESRYQTVSRYQNDYRSPDIVAAEIRDSWTSLDTVKSCWRCYIPAGLTGTATIACIIGANVVGMRRNAALLAAYTLADTTFREYKAKVIEHITPQKAQKIDDEIMEERIRRNPPSTETIIIAGGDQLCYESLTGRYFKSDAEKIRRAALDVDACILNDDMYASANEFFRLLGLDSCTIGSEMGWTIECRLKVVLSSHKTDDDQTALAIGYEKLPVFNYDKL